ncbi:MAG TPA: c-type cytochrome [Polyangia bacterium]
MVRMVRTLMFGAAAWLAGAAACTSSEPASPFVGLPQPPVTMPPTSSVPVSSGPGPGQSQPTAVDAGVAIGSSCGTDGGAVGIRPPPGGSGFTPQIPQTVVHQTTAVPPLTGGTLLALSDGNTVVASDPERDQMYVVDLTTNALRATLALQPGDEPGRLVEDGAGLVHVALRRGGAVVSIDPAKGTLGVRRAVCSAPRGIAFEAATGLLHVACVGGELVSLPAAGGAPTRTLALPTDLRDVVVASGGKLMVSTFRSATVLVVDSKGAVSTQLQPTSGVKTSLLGMPQHRSPAVAWRMQSMGAGQDSIVMLHQSDVDDVIDPANGGYAGLKGCGAIAEPGVTVLSVGGTAPPVAASLMMVSLAIDLAVSPDLTKVALAVPGNASVPNTAGVVEVLLDQINGSFNAGNNDTCINAAPPTGITPPGGEVIAVTYTKSGVLLAQTREPETLWRADNGVAIGLATNARTDTGHLIFHVNAGGGLACASCHPEGGEDGRVWDFACIGARRTQSIRGSISATAPFHWDGSEPDFSHLMDDVFVARMSGPMLSADQKQALQNWVDTIPALPAVAGLDASAVARGKTVFNDQSVACASCHAGALLTNNSTVDVGTGGMLQVPSLRGVAWRAPYMHNGCAPTLADRFGSCGGGDKHGVTSSLSTAQMNDLLTYLQSL